jgi:ABC-type transporter Mla subunit MlaD
VKIPTVNDLVKIGTEQVEALMALPETIVALNKSLVSLAQTISSLDTLVKRLDRLTEPFEEPLAALAPRMAALVTILDEDLLNAIPTVLDSVSRNAVPALEVIGQTQAQVASIASSVDRLMGMMDDTFSRLGDLPGAGLVSRLRGGTGAVPAPEKSIPRSGGRAGGRFVES